MRCGGQSGGGGCSALMTGAGDQSQVCGRKVRMRASTPVRAPSGGVREEAQEPRL